MKQLKFKIVMSVAGILLGITMIASASYAWLTVSVTPEIQRLVITVTPSGKEVPFEFSINYDDVGFNEEAATWTTELHLNEQDQNGKPKKYTLQPISTIDGTHWYLPKYSADGNVKGFWQLPNDRMSAWANKPNTKDNYLYYVDVYVRTRNKDKAQEMIISNPIINNLSAGEHHFASYVLWDPEWVENADGTTTIKDNDAMASVRVGFQYTTLDTDGKTEKSTGPFFIYEPNADMRSQDFMAFLNGQAGASQMQDQIYVYNGTEKEADIVKEYQDNYKEGEYYPTYVPKYDSTAPEKYKLVNVNTELGNRLVAQEKSSWDTSKLVQGQTPTSDAIKTGTIGELCIVEGGELKPTATTSRKELTTVTHGTIQKMRLFIWIEGQDIDCWNQVADGNLYVNLEFMGRGGASITTQE